MTYHPVKHYHPATKEGLPMAAVRIRARVRQGRLEPVGHVDLPEGEEVTLTVDLPETAQHRGAAALASWDLGVKEPLTRDEIYGDRV